MNEENKQDWKSDVPFPRHRLAYVVIKWLLIAIAVYVTLKLTGVL